MSDEILLGGEPAVIIEHAIAKIEMHPAQPRHHFDEEKLNELADDFRKGGIGQTTEIWTRPHPTKEGWLQCLNGDRRIRAMKIAKKSTIRCKSADLDDEQALKLVFADHGEHAHVKLHQMDRAISIAQLRDVNKLSMEEIAELHRMPRSTAALLYPLATLPQEWQDRFRDDQIGQKVAKHIAAVAHVPKMIAAVEKEWGKSDAFGSEAGILELLDVTFQANARPLDKDTICWWDKPIDKQCAIAFNPNKIEDPAALEIFTLPYLHTSVDSSTSRKKGKAAFNVKLANKLQVEKVCPPSDERVDSFDDSTESPASGSDGVDPFTEAADSDAAAAPADATNEQEAEKERQRKLTEGIAAWASQLKNWWLATVIENAAKLLPIHSALLLWYAATGKAKTLDAAVAEAAQNAKIKAGDTGDTIKRLLEKGDEAAIKSVLGYLLTPANWKRQQDVLDDECQAYALTALEFDIEQAWISLQSYATDTDGDGYVGLSEFFGMFTGPFLKELCRSELEFEPESSGKADIIAELLSYTRNLPCPRALKKQYRRSSAA